MAEDISGNVQSDVEFVASAKGGLVLLLDGRQYNKKKDYQNGNRFWACQRKQCIGSITLSKENKIVKTTQHEENCPQNFTKNVIRKELDLLRKKVTTDLRPIPKQYNETICRLQDKGVHLIEEVPQFSSVKTALYNAKNKALKVPKSVCTNPADVVVPATHEKFLLADYTDANDQFNRILVFSSEEAKKYMVERKHFYADGTFKSCCEPFLQLFVIFGDIGNDSNPNIIPLIYALMTTKTERSYNILLQIIKSQIPLWNPEKFTLDFELSSRNAIVKLFPNIEVKGCFYHFSASLRRKAKAIGGMKSQINRRHVSLCTGLALLPVEDIDDGWSYIINESPNNEFAENFNIYMYNQWLSSSTFRNIWCCQKERNRTTNKLEGWNSRLNRFVGRSKPALPYLLDVLRDDAKFYGINRSQKNRNFTATRIQQQVQERHARINRAIIQLQEKKITVGHCLEKICPYAY